MEVRLIGEWKTSKNMVKNTHKTTATTKYIHKKMINKAANAFVQEKTNTPWH